jgi:hypothetical protein
MTIKCVIDRSGFAGQTDFDFLGFSTETRPASGPYRDDARKITVSWFVIASSSSLCKAEDSRDHCRSVCHRRISLIGIPRPKSNEKIELSIDRQHGASREGIIFDIFSIPQSHSRPLWRPF